MSSKKISASIGSLITAFLAMSGWAAMNWQERSNLNEATISFEKQKLQQERDILQKELAFEKRQIELRLTEERLISNRTQLASREEALAMASRAVSTAQQNISAETRRLAESSRTEKEISEINALMTQVSELGVDLSKEPPCENQDALRQYHRGHTLMRQIYARAKAANLQSRYQYFIIANSGMTIFPADHCKKAGFSIIQYGDSGGTRTPVVEK